MPTNKPRINVALEKRLYQAVNYLSRVRGVSMSSIIRTLLDEALELQEDIVLSEFADKREKTLSADKTMTHDEVWR